MKKWTYSLLFLLSLLLLFCCCYNFIYSALLRSKHVQSGNLASPGSCCPETSVRDDVIITRPLWDVRNGKMPRPQQQSEHIRLYISTSQIVR